MESILTSIKKMLGLDENYEPYDQDIILLINSVLTDSNMLGVGPSDGFQIYSKTERWSDFIGERQDISFIREYIYLKVRITFDPPQAGHLMEAVKERIKELEWKINVQLENVNLEQEKRGNDVIFDPIGEGG